MIVTRKGILALLNKIRGGFKSMNYIGVDLGGTNSVVGLVNEEGVIIDSIEMPTHKERGVESIFDDIIMMCQQIIDRHHVDASELKGIGIGIPGTIDSKNKVIIYSNNIKISQFNVKAYMSKHFDRPIEIANDADCAALGEAIAGAGRDCDSLVVFTLGTGVGGGIIIDKKIFNGSFPGGAEIGHQVIVQGGKMCSCGNEGCLEAYASATGLINLAKEQASLHPESLLSQMMEENGGVMNAKIPFDAAGAGDNIGKAVIDEYIGYLATGINNIVNIFKPEKVLIGGGVSRQKDNLIIPLTQKVRGQVFGGELLTRIEVAQLGNDAGLIGAAMLNR